jgi:hypothetical protein
VDVLGCLELDVRALAGVKEQVLVVRGLLDHVRAYRVARLPVVEVVELRQPLADAGGLAIGARAGDLVGEERDRYGAREDVE